MRPSFKIGRNRAESGSPPLWLDHLRRRGLLESLFGVGNDLGERLGLANCQVREHLAVDVGAGELQAVDEFAVGDSVDPGCRVNADVPETPHVALLLASMGVRILEGVN